MINGKCEWRVRIILTVSNGHVDINVSQDVQDENHTYLDNFWLLHTLIQTHPTSLSLCLHGLFHQNYPVISVSSLTDPIFRSKCSVKIVAFTCIKIFPTYFQIFSKSKLSSDSWSTSLVSMITESLSSSILGSLLFSPDF